MESNGVIRALIPRGKRSEMIGLADFSQRFGRKPNGRARFKESGRTFGATRPARKLRWKNVDKRRAPLADQVESERGSPVESRRGDRESGGWIEQSIFAGGVRSIAGRVDRPPRDVEDKVKVMPVSFATCATKFWGCAAAREEARLRPPT